MAGTTDDVNAILDTARADRSVWLMKCPHVIAQSWKEISEPGQLLAKITVSVDPLKKHDLPMEKQNEDPTAPRYTVAEADKREKKEMKRQSNGNIKSEFTMDVPSNGPVSAPKSYALNMTADIVPMCVFSETSQGKMAIDGKVEHKFDMTPHSQNIDDYRKLCRERTSKFNYKARKVQVIDNERGGYTPVPMVDFSAHNVKDRKGTAVPVKAQEMKRTRMDRDELVNILFKLFEQQPNWTLKQLVTSTDQPQQFIKEILSDLGIYNKRGANQGTYELKPEYKKTTEEAENE